MSYVLRQASDFRRKFNLTEKADEAELQFRKCYEIMLAFERALKAPSNAGKLNLFEIVLKDPSDEARLNLLHETLVYYDSVIKIINKADYALCPLN